MFLSGRSKVSHGSVGRDESLYSGNARCGLEGLAFPASCFFHQRREIVGSIKDVLPCVCKLPLVLCRIGVLHLSERLEADGHLFCTRKGTQISWEDLRMDHLTVLARA